MKYIIDSVEESELRNIPIVLNYTYPLEDSEYESTAVEAVLTNISKDESKEELVLVIR